jgi:hypothetical protein
MCCRSQRQSICMWLEQAVKRFGSFRKPIAFGSRFVVFSDFVRW